MKYLCDIIENNITILVLFAIRNFAPFLAQFSKIIFVSWPRLLDEYHTTAAKN
jgi:hypothetical protein